jgi:hypothetical protein
MHYKLVDQETRQEISYFLVHRLQIDCAAHCLLFSAYREMFLGWNVNLTSQLHVELRWIFTSVPAMYPHIVSPINRTVLQFITITIAVILVLLLRPGGVLATPPCYEDPLLRFIFGGDYPYLRLFMFFSEFFPNNTLKQATIASLHVLTN